MSNVREGRRAKKIAMEVEPSSWKEKKELADKEQEALEKELYDLKTWADTIDGMSDDQLKEYLKNRPEELKTVNTKTKPKAQGIGKPKASARTGIMASIWKFHREDDDNNNNHSNNNNNEECSVTSGA